jgi:UDP-N-acetylmuramate dehydrogenase
LNIRSDIQHDVALAPLTTFKIGGRARLFVRAETEQDVADTVVFSKQEGLDLFVLGGGSNVLISDEGFDGLVLHIALKGISRVDGNNVTVFVSAMAGEDWDSFVAGCVADDLAGVECLSGIPGYVGGTPVQNVGAYGQEVSETIVSVDCLDRPTGEFVTLTNEECGFTYRTSILNSTERDRYIVLKVTFALQSGGSPKVAYKDLTEHFESREPNLAEVRNAVLEIRRAKSMVIDENDPNTQCAGSFFKNPVVEREKFDEIRASFPDAPHFDFGSKVKVPAAWLIDKAGFKKGYALGQAGISTKHNLALVNRGMAAASDIVALKEQITHAVEDKFGICLVPEPVFVGFE